MQEATLALSLEKLPTIEELVELYYEPVFRFLRHLAIDRTNDPKATPAQLKTP